MHCALNNSLKPLTKGIFCVKMPLKANKRASPFGDALFMEENMRKLPTRQVHLDFHTGEQIPAVADSFDKAHFQRMLKEADLNSITVFAKCHHGMCYYPTEIGVQHPGMKKGFDLTGAEIDAAHEIGVAAPVYITVGWSEWDANRHPEWRQRAKDGSYPCPEADLDAPRPPVTWQNLCPNGEYAEQIYRQTEEICRRYKELDGLFYDIVYLWDTCHCDACIAEMKANGEDPYDDDANRKNYIRVHKRFAQRCGEILHSYHPEASIFFNTGGAEIYRPEYHEDQTHFEMEDLPTAWGGYDKFAPRAEYMRRYGKDFLGMTGKFHGTWGEFGGFKNATALKFELAMMGMYGAACSIGDQMHPSGRLDEDTYRLIGEGYRFYHSFEPWFFDATPTADVGVYLSSDGETDQGLQKMLLENQIDFSFVLPGDDLSQYRLLILPDSVMPDEDEAKRIDAFKGAILSSGESLISDGKYTIDNGVTYEGDSPYDIDYLSVGERLPLWVKNPFLCYTPSLRMRATDATVLADVYEPYFKRTNRHFCSHQYTPYRPTPSGYAGVARKGLRITFAHKICKMYYRTGMQLYRDLFISALKSVYTPKCRVSLPSGARMRLTEQKGTRRYVLHLAYAQPIARGNFSVIEDTPVFYNVPVSLSIERPIKEIRVANGEAIRFEEKDGTVEFSVPVLHIYTAIEILY